MVLPHLDRLPVWLFGLVALALGWKWYLVRRDRLPAKWMLILAALAATGGIILSYGGVHGRLAGTALLVAMLALKLVETHTRRDGALVVYYFLVATTFLFTQDIPIALLMVVAVLVNTVTLMSFGTPAGIPALRLRVRLAATMMVTAVPLAAILFLLFPRLPGPLWGVPEDSETGITGISDSMRPGRISQLMQSDAPAFRVQFDGDPPSLSDRYWRGPVLWDFDGDTWTMLRRKIRYRPWFDASQPRTEHTVTLEPHGRRWLFALDVPVTTPNRSLLTSSSMLFSADAVVTTRQYRIASIPNPVQKRRIRSWERLAGIQLPDGFNPRTLALGRQWREQGLHPDAIVRRALSMYRDQGFIYTLNPPILGLHSVDEFLFEVKAGFCEMYAASFVTLMRAAGVPARVVTGYLGGEINRLGDYMIVRQSDAHAWAEVWLDGVGWRRIDPTGAVAPARVQRGIQAALPAGEALPFLSRRQEGLWRDMRLALDAVDNFWNQWVLGYGPALQKEFLTGIGLGRHAWQVALLMLGLLALLMVPIAWSLLRRRPISGTRDPATRLYFRLCHQLARVGVERLPNEAPRSFTERAARRLPDHAAQIRQAGELVTRLRYARQPPSQALAKLEALVRRLRPRKLRAQS